MIGSIAIESTAKSTALFGLSMLGGWLCVGRIARAPGASRTTTVSVVDTFGVYAVSMTIIALMVLGPHCIDPGLGGSNNQVSIFSLRLSRLGTQGMNATGVSSLAGVGFIYLLLSLRRAPSVFVSVLLFALLTVCFGALLWSGSRGALLATIAVLVTTELLSTSARTTRRASIARFLFVIMTCSVVGLTLTENFWRTTSWTVSSETLFDAFVLSRLNDNAPSLDWSFFGTGYNSLGGLNSLNAADIESYWLKAWVELGVVGSAAYTLAFALGTASVIAADRQAARQRDPSAGLATAIVMFVWANSVSSWGFIYPYGDMFICLALMSSSSAFLGASAPTRIQAASGTSSSCIGAG
jgi:hypothetical protein